MSSKLPVTREQKNKLVSMLRFIPDEPYLKLMYRVRMGKKLNLRNPQTFNEKIQWLKLHDRKPEYVTMVDKYEAKKYVANIIGEEYIIPTLGVWDRFEDIDFASLPNQFVLKCTHDSGGLVICRDKASLDIEAARKKINASLRTNFFWVGREWPYKDVKPRIIAEEYMEDEDDHELRDYKFFAFDGVAKALFIATDRGDESVDTKFDFFDMDFRHLNITNGHPNADPLPHKPETFEKMRALAEKLSVGIPQVRVDFYEVNGKAYFGEITLAHWSGMKPFVPEEWDYTFGSWIKLPESYGGGYAVIGDGYILRIKKREKAELRDYKVFCFNGEPKLFYLSEGLENHKTARMSFVTLDWKFAKYTRSDYAPFEKLPPRPKNLEKMIELAKVLSKGTRFLRVDLYEINGRIYFGELTFHPNAGFNPFEKEEYDRELGSFMKL